jgi:hypothetical protein
MKIVNKLDPNSALPQAQNFNLGIVTLHRSKQKKQTKKVDMELLHCIELHFQWAATQTNPMYLYYSKLTRRYNGRVV